MVVLYLQSKEARRLTKLRLRRCIRAPADSASRASLGGIVMLKLGTQWQWQAAAAHAGGKLAGGARASWAVRPGCAQRPQILDQVDGPPRKSSPWLSWPCTSAA